MRVQRAMSRAEVDAPLLSVLNGCDACEKGERVLKDVEGYFDKVDEDAGEICHENIEDGGEGGRLIARKTVVVVKVGNLVRETLNVKGMEYIQMLLVVVVSLPLCTGDEVSVTGSSERGVANGGARVCRTQLTQTGVAATDLTSFLTVTTVPEQEFVHVVPSVR